MKSKVLLKYLVHGCSIIGTLPSESRKYLENLKINWGHSLVPSLFSRNKFLTIAIKNYAKADIKEFLSYPILLDCFAFFLQNIPSNIFCGSKFLLVARPGLLETSISCNFFNFEAFLSLNPYFLSKSNANLN